MKKEQTLNCLSFTKRFLNQNIDEPNAIIQDYLNRIEILKMNKEAIAKM